MLFVEVLRTEDEQDAHPSQSYQPSDIGAMNAVAAPTEAVNPTGGSEPGVIIRPDSKPSTGGTLGEVEGPNQTGSSLEGHPGGDSIDEDLGADQTAGSGLATKPSLPRTMSNLGVDSVWLLPCSSLTSAGPSSEIPTTAWPSGMGNIDLDAAAIKCLPLRPASTTGTPPSLSPPKTLSIPRSMSTSCFPGGTASSSSFPAGPMIIPQRRPTSCLAHQSGGGGGAPLTVGDLLSTVSRRASLTSATATPRVSRDTAADPPAWTAGRDSPEAKSAAAVRSVEPGASSSDNGETEEPQAAPHQVASSSSNPGSLGAPTASPGPSSSDSPAAAPAAAAPEPSIGLAASALRWLTGQYEKASHSTASAELDHRGQGSTNVNGAVGSKGSILSASGSGAAKPIPSPGTSHQVSRSQGTLPAPPIHLQMSSQAVSSHNLSPGSSLFPSSGCVQ